MEDWASRYTSVSPSVKVETPRRRKVSARVWRKLRSRTARTWVPPGAGGPAAPPCPAAAARRPWTRSPPRLVISNSSSQPVAFPRKRNIVRILSRWNVGPVAFQTCSKKPCIPSRGRSAGPLDTQLILRLMCGRQVSKSWAVQSIGSLRGSWWPPCPASRTAALTAPLSILTNRCTVFKKNILTRKLEGKTSHWKMFWDVFVTSILWVKYSHKITWDINVALLSQRPDSVCVICFRVVFVFDC